MKKKIICLIPARSASKRIRNKNIIKIKNKPLIKLVVDKILKSNLIKEYYVASDKKYIFDQIKSKSKQIFFFQRSSFCSKSTSTTESVINEFLKKTNIDADIIVLLQITNPFISSKILDNAINFFLKKKYDSLLSVVESKHFLWKISKKTCSINYNYKKRERSQNIQSYYVENGSFYIFYKKNYEKYKNRLHGKIGLFKMPLESYYEIDNLKDLEIIKKLV